MTIVLESLVSIASSSGLTITKVTMILDSGASKYFINIRLAFKNLVKFNKPFCFDQAVSKSTLSHGGTACEGTKAWSTWNTSDVTKLFIIYYNEPPEVVNYILK